MNRDTSIGGPESRFPVTRASLLAAVRSSDPDARRQAYETLLRAYWKPAYKYLRLRWRSPNEEAEDLTQGFFAKAFEAGFLERYDPAKARFRTWLRLCLDGFVSNERKAAARLKRGGGEAHFSIDLIAGEHEAAALAGSAASDPDALFRREWVRALFEDSLEDLRVECAALGKQTVFVVFERYDLHEPPDAPRPSYADLAAEFQVPVTQVTNHLAWARREFRQRVLERLRASTGSEEEFRAEAGEILGGDPL